MRLVVVLCGLCSWQAGVASAAAGVEPPGLTGLVVLPPAPTGATRSIVDFGATPDDPAEDDAGAIQDAIDASASGDEVLVPNGVRGESRSGAVLCAAFTPQEDGKNAYAFYGAPGTSDLTLSSFHITSDGSTDADTALNNAIWLGDGDSECQECNHDIPRGARDPRHRRRGEQFMKMALNIRNGHDLTMDGNLVHDALANGGGGQRYGIMLGYDQTADNWIHHNLVERGIGMMRHGIPLQHRANHNLVEHNTVRELSENSIDLRGGDENANEVSHNVVHDSARAGIGVGNTGRETDLGASGPANWIHHNEVYGSREGLHLIMGSDVTRIEFNDFHDNAEFGIQVFNGGGDGLRVRCNTLTGNGVGMSLEDSTDTLAECNDTIASTSESLAVADNVTGYTVRHNDFRGAPVTVDSDRGSYADNCDDENGVTDRLATCPADRRTASQGSPRGKENQ